MILSEFGITVSIGLSYVALHFLLYVCLLRGRPLFQSEQGLFLYHFISAIVFTILELWTLAEGSYSMSILTGIASQGTLSRNRLIDAFARIGDAKKGNRLSVLSNLSLARREGSHWQLSTRGRVVASVLKLLVWLAAIQNRG